MVNDTVEADEKITVTSVDEVVGLARLWARLLMGAFGLLDRAQ